MLDSNYHSYIDCDSNMGLTRIIQSVPLDVEHGFNYSEEPIYPSGLKAVFNDEQLDIVPRVTLAVLKIDLNNLKKGGTNSREILRRSLFHLGFTLNYGYIVSNRRKFIEFRSASCKRVIMSILRYVISNEENNIKKDVYEIKS